VVFSSGLYENMAGYSATPLAKKLGIKPGHCVALVNAPEAFEYLLEGLPTDAAVARDLADAKAFDVLVCFVTDAKQLRTTFPRCVKKLITNGGLWVAWPKKTSGISTDLTENVVRIFGLDTGLVDNKVCAIDETWSGLRFVIRLQDRPKK
jgi:hypothetical protein